MRLDIQKIFGHWLVGIASLLLGMHNSQAWAQSPTKFYWVVENNNRVITSDSGQDRFQYELCRALDCSRKSVSAPTFPFCHNIVGVHADKLRRAALLAGRTPTKSTASATQFCPPDRYKGPYWEPLPDQIGATIGTAWNAKILRYQRNDDYVNGKRRIVVAWVPAATTETCSWKLTNGDADYVPGSCHQFKREVELGRDYQLSLRITRADGTVENVPPRSIRVDDVFIVALGDSYSSGEGNPHGLRGFSAKHGLDSWWDRRCHRSLFNFSSLAVSIASMQDQHFGDAVKHSFTYMNFACSGAEIKGETPDGGGVLEPYVGRETVPQLTMLKKLFPKANIADEHNSAWLPRQIEQLQDNLCPGSVFPCADYRQPDYITLTIGGNDVGFGPLIREYIKGCRSLMRECPSRLLDTRFAKLERQFDDLAQEINAIGVRRRVLLVEYIDLTRNERRDFCDDFSMKKTLGPSYVHLLGGLLRISPASLGYGVGPREAEKAYKEVLKRLNELLKKVATKYEKQGWLFISGVARRSEIRGWCASPSWFNRFDDSVAKQGTLPDDLQKEKLSRELTTGVAHPNIFGHNFMNWRIRCQLELDKILPPGSTQEDGKTPATKCE